jgi:hypothetical protein
MFNQISTFSTHQFVCSDDGLVRLPWTHVYSFRHAWTQRVRLSGELGKIQELLVVDLVLFLFSHLDLV